MGGPGWMGRGWWDQGGGLVGVVGVQGVGRVGVGV